MRKLSMRQRLDLAKMHPMLTRSVRTATTTPLFGPHANTPCKDSDDNELIFEPDANMRRLLKDQEDVVRQAAAKMNNRFKGKSALKITTCYTSSLRLNRCNRLQCFDLWVGAGRLKSTCS